MFTSISSSSFGGLVVDYFIDSIAAPPSAPRYHTSQGGTKLHIGIHVDCVGHIQDVCTANMFAVILKFSGPPRVSRHVGLVRREDVGENALSPLHLGKSKLSF